jgi:hypothetical protein
MPVAAQRILFAVLALCAGGGVLIGLAMSAFAPTIAPPAEPGLFAPTTTLQRLGDDISYFTYWSNILVAVVFGLLAVRTAGRGLLMRVLLFDALLMITVTGLVYAIVLAPSAPPAEGWDLASRLLVHYIAPPLALVVFAVAGPRGWLRAGLIPRALILPLGWLAYTFVRGTLVDTYPYGFINVVQLGYGMALVNTGAILLIGVVLCFVLVGIERIASRRGGPIPETA